MAKFELLLGGLRTFLILTAITLAGWFQFPPNAARADVPESQKHEVQHLLDFISRSGCRMVRNGSAHEAAESVKHIQRKYDYYRDDIQTTEDFIDKSARKSTMSGKVYTVECPGQKTRPTAEWLKEELRRYRAQKGRG